MSFDVWLTSTGVAIQALLLRLGLAVILLLGTLLIASWARSTFERATSRTNADQSVRLLASRVVHAGVLLVGLVLALGVVGVDQGSILATFGALGLALGLAVQDILKSFFAGLYLLFERPFLIGDEVQVRDHVGRVEHVGFRATSIRTADNSLVVIPNAIVFAEAVSNRSARVAQPSSPLPDEAPPQP